jgi:hypothetical protein
MNLRLVWLGVAVFVMALIAMQPVKWITPLVPAQVRCASWSGSVWQGQCDGLVVQQAGPALQVQSLRWKLHPLPLLRLAVRGDFNVRTDMGTGSGVAEFGRNGRMAIEDMVVRAVFDRRLATMLAEGWKGQLETRDLTIGLQGNSLQALEGEVALLDFKDAQRLPSSSTPTAAGSSMA